MKDMNAETHYSSETLISVTDYVCLQLHKSFHKISYLIFLFVFFLLQ